MKLTASRQTLAYIGLLSLALAAAVVVRWSFGAQLDNNAYDWMFQSYEPPPWRPSSVILAIDEATLTHFRGMRNIRRPLAEGLRRVALAHPRAVAVDIILADPSDPRTDGAMEDALRITPNLVLDCDLLQEGAATTWEDPLPRFAKFATAIGHVHIEPDSDWVTRRLTLEKYTRDAAGHTANRRWALALEAFRLSRGEPPPVETFDLHPRGRDDVSVGALTIPAYRTREGRNMRIRYLPPNPALPQIPRISLKRLLEDPAQQTAFAGKVVFAGVTAQSEVRDRLATPYSGFGWRPLVGVEIHANAFETMNTAQFITDVWMGWEFLFCLLLVIAAGAIFYYLHGWFAYSTGVLLLAAAHLTPYLFFTHGRVLSFVMPALSAWLSLIAAAAWQLLVVRRNLFRSEAERLRYQQAMHFVTHEMRTPLSAIQGSSELISRYALTEEKRKQVADLINSESKRLARMIEVFLNVEKLSAGQMELKHEDIAIADLVDICVLRTRPLADRKHIEIAPATIDPSLHVTGDRELMEYACYNLLTNAVKYSPQKTRVTISGRMEDGQVRVAVEDQGIGMDQKEVKQIFQKFYRTKKAEQSGEAGTGIGLSIVNQIVEQHHGRIDVVSRPGEGSCFTLVLPTAHAPGATAAKRN